MPAREADLASWHVGQCWARAAETLFSALDNPRVTEGGHSSGKAIFSEVIGARNAPFAPHPVDFRDALPAAFLAYATAVAVPGKATLVAGTVLPALPPPVPPPLDSAWSLPQSDSAVPFANAILNVVRPWLSTGVVTVPAGGVVPWT